ncbi:MAG: hypothetical protein ACR2HQ_00685, partial [Ilumatobacteraceae bacterium]
GGAIDAVVDDLRFEGHDALVHLRLGPGATPETILARWSTVDLPAVDSRVSVAVRGGAVVYPVATSPSPDIGARGGVAAAGPSVAAGGGCGNRRGLRRRS